MRPEIELKFLRGVKYNWRAIYENRANIQAAFKNIKTKFSADYLRAAQKGYGFYLATKETKESGADGVEVVTFDGEASAEEIETWVTAKINKILGK